MPALPTQGPPPPRIRIEDLEPDVDCGLFRAKRCTGDLLEVAATIFRDGHDVLRAVARYRPPGADDWREVTMTRPDPTGAPDRWHATLPLDVQGRWAWRVEAWSDPFATWRNELERKVAAGQTDLDPELAEGAAILDAVRRRASPATATRLDRAARLVEDTALPAESRTAAALDPQLATLCEPLPEKAGRG